METSKTEAAGHGFLEERNDELLFLDPEEWSKTALDWERRGQVTSWRTDQAFFRVLLWFILIAGGIAVLVLLIPTLSPFGLAWRSPLPVHSDDAALLLLTIFFICSSVKERRKHGERISRLSFREGVFEVLTKRKERTVRIPVDILKSIQIGTHAYSADGFHVTLVEENGRKYTLELTSDMHRVDTLRELCQRLGVPVEQSRESWAQRLLHYTFGGALFLFWFVATDSTEWFAPMVAVMATFLLEAAHVGKK